MSTARAYERSTGAGNRSAHRMSDALCDLKRRRVECGVSRRENPSEARDGGVRRVAGSGRRRKMNDNVLFEVNDQGLVSEGDDDDDAIRDEFERKKPPSNDRRSRRNIRHFASCLHSRR